MKPSRSAAQGSGSQPGYTLLDSLASGGLIIAHRGYRACFPENTPSAFAASLGRCGMIELDVRLSADKVAVIFHDPMLTRTSDAATKAVELGLTSLELQDWRLDQLRRLDAGSWFLQSDPFGTLHNGLADRDQLSAHLPQPVPTLHEMLAWAMVHRMPLNIELKDLGSAQRNEELVACALEEIRLANATTRVLLSSFNHDLLRLCRSLAPDIATAALQETEHPDDLIRYLHSLSVCAYHPAAHLAEPNLIRELRSAGLHVNVFTVNDPVRQHQLFAAGSSGIFTDYPAIL